MAVKRLRRGTVTSHGLLRHLRRHSPHLALHLTFGHAHTHLQLIVRPRPLDAREVLWLLLLVYGRAHVTSELLSSKLLSILRWMLRHPMLRI